MLVVIDQFEELFTGTIDADEQRAFLELLAGVADVVGARTCASS